MRKILGIFCIILLSVQLVACGKTDDVANDYNEDVDAVISSIEEMNSYSDAVLTTSISVWNEVGVDYFAIDFVIMKELSSVEEVGQTPDNRVFAGDLQDLLGITAKMSTSETPMEYGERTGLYQKVYDFCETFQGNYANIERIKSTLQDDVKEFKNKYEEEYPEVVDVMLEYYYASDAYAELALEPVGSLLTYSSDKKNCEQEISELKTKLEMEK